jgi:hypothetical protein
MDICMAIKASVLFQFLCYDRLLWRSRELAIQDYGVCDVDSPVKWQHYFLFTWGGDGKEE